MQVGRSPQLKSSAAQGKPRHITLALLSLAIPPGPNFSSSTPGGSLSVPWPRAVYQAEAVHYKGHTKVAAPAVAYPGGFRGYFEDSVTNLGFLYRQNAGGKSDITHTSSLSWQSMSLGAVGRERQDHECSIVITCCLRCSYSAVLYLTRCVSIVGMYIADSRPSHDASLQVKHRCKTNTDMLQFC